MTREGAPSNRQSLPAAVAALAGLAGLAVLGALAARPEVSEWEVAAFSAVNRLAGGWWYALYPLMQAGTLAAGPVAAVLALVARRRLLALHLATAGMLAWLAARGLKLLVDRPRPSVLLDDVVVHGTEAGGLGYPSGHVTVAVALAAVLAPHLPARWRWAVWALAAAVGIARLYVGAHLPLDVVGGVLLGGLVGAGVRWLVGCRSAPARGASSCMTLG